MTDRIRLTWTGPVISEEVYATGKAGTVYLCHPFMVHSAQTRKGSVPKFMAQPPLLLKGELSIADADVDLVENGP